MTEENAIPEGQPAEFEELPVPVLPPKPDPEIPTIFTLEEKIAILTEKVILLTGLTQALSKTLIGFMEKQRTEKGGLV